MSVESLCDHVADVYELVASKGSMGQIEEVYGPTPKITGAVCLVRVDQQSLRDIGPGEARVERWKIGFPDATLDIKARDVISLVDGANASLRVRVLAPYAPRGHHLEVYGETWDGEITSA